MIVFILGIAFKLGYIDDNLWFGGFRIGPAGFHPLVLLYVASGTAMVSATLRVPKP